MSSFAHPHVISDLYEFRLLQKKVFFEEFWPIG